MGRNNTNKQIIKKMTDINLGIELQDVERELLNHSPEKERREMLYRRRNQLRSERWNRRAGGHYVP